MTSKKADEELATLNSRGSAISPTGLDCFTIGRPSFMGEPQCIKSGFHCIHYEICKNPNKSKHK